MAGKLIQRFFIITILCSVFVLRANSQTPVKDYKKEWKKVESFTDKNLPESALAEVKKIYALAKKEKQDAQVIKALIYMDGLQDEIREDNEIFSIADIEKEIAVSSEPVLSILKSLEADKYWKYFQDHRWNLYDRTETVPTFKKTDIATWSAGDFHKKISELYLRSLKEEKLLQQIRPETFEAIIVSGNVRHLRPTLYDLLAHKAILYFENDEQDVEKPAYAFEIDKDYAFDPASSFITKKFPTLDSLALQQKALIIYQKLIAFHLNDTKPDALIDLDINRIEFVHQNSVHPDKEQLYLNALTQITKRYKNLPAAAQAWYLIAQSYDNKAAEYKPFGDTSHRFDRVRAREICQQVLAQRDSSEGRINCYNLLLSINRQEMQFSIEKVNIPGQAFRTFIQYRNFTMLYLRLVRADDNLKKILENPTQDEKYWTALLNASPLKTWQQNLPSTNDLQKHNTEIKVDGLPSGEYLLITSTDKSFKGKNTITGARYFYVSWISYTKNNDDFFILNRDNGQPLAKASVQIWENKYDYQQSKYIKQKAKLYQADANGFFKMERKRDNTNRYDNYSYLLDITYGGDHLFMNDWTYDYTIYQNSTEEIKTVTNVFLFTDRSIYRPGQTLYFKGIVLMKNEKAKTGSVRKDYLTTVILRNTNGENVDSIKVKTNEFGSFSGTFKLPASGLTGDFSLYTEKDAGNASFRVEEYKRPKFYVEYEPIKGTYKVNDKIKVTGLAKAYAGNMIDGAMVKYRVVRQPRYIYSWYFWKMWQPPVKEMEITHGEVKTDKDGKFIVEFNAIPDLTIDKKYDPVFDYTVYADVTDINGETRSGEQRVSVSYKALMLVAMLPDALPTDSLRSLPILTENMNGEFQPATVKVTFTKLKEEKRLIRERLWERPDQFVMTKEEYVRNFPNDEYDNETDYKSWEKGQMIFEKTDSSRRDGKWSVERQWIIGMRQWEAGFYMIEITAKDSSGEEVKDIKYIELYDEKSNQLNHPKYTWYSSQYPKIEPGQTARLEIGTAADNLFVVQQVDKGATGNKAGSTKYDFITLNNEKKVFTFPADESDRGGYGVVWMFIKHNRLYQVGETITVPWTNKDLKIEYATYRDKTLPGSEEKWKIKISGYNNEKVAAEVLATMYDASLDQFSYHGWGQPSIWPYYYSFHRWNSDRNFTKEESMQKYPEVDESKYLYKEYDYLFSAADEDFHVLTTAVPFLRIGRGSVAYLQKAASPTITLGSEMRFSTNANAEVSLSGYASGLKAEFMDINKDGVADQTDKEPQQQAPQPSGDIKIRKNFNETAFFFPDLRTDSTGAIEFSFTMPEALTKWKFMALAHTKDASFGSTVKEIVTQKDLMVQPNAPRFLREGDKMEFSSKVVNLTNKELTGQAQLQLIDAATNEPVDGWFRNMYPAQFFTVAAGQSEVVKFPIEVPYLFNKALVWRIVAQAGNFSDGEEMAMPVLTNRMLVTETLTLPMRGAGTKNFSFDKLLNSDKSETLQNYSLTVEYTSNPAWYAIQSLPYLMEYPYECAEQTWNRYYANSLATFIANSSPRIKQVFEQWKIKDTAALMSNLQKNQELKAVLLEETPWVLQAKTEAEQKKNIALLFDMVRMTQQLNNSYEKLKQMQSSNGGFVWFSGGPDDRYITQYIVTGIGHLRKLKATASGQDANLKAILASAIPYLDKKIKEDYDNLVKYKTDLKKYTPDYTTIQYLYMRSFFSDHPVANASMTAYNYFRGRAQQTWTSQSKYMEGMIALALYRTGDTKTPVAILKSLKETSIVNEELGMYWKDQRHGWFWYEAPIETQSLLIEAFQEVGKDTKTVDDLKTWLLKNKQTNDWTTTKATAEACYALLLQGTQWISNDPVIQIKLGATTISSTDNKQEAGTGYFKKVINGEKVTPQMGNISVTVAPLINPSTNQPINSATWGGVYWQYFEDLDNITTATGTPLKLVKKLFVEKNTDRGPVLTPINEGDVVKVGDKIKVRVELRVDRDMEYVHMKDMRASGTEPVNVLSSYKWQGGLGYYESTKDASTNFFFSNLPKGTYVFEYPLFVTHAGNFSNGVTTIQCMYAPEFSSHSEGIRINVEQ